MKIDVKIILFIVFISSLLGLIYNYFSPSGIPLIAEEKKLHWAEDSLFNSTYEESFQKTDTLTRKEDVTEDMKSIPEQDKEKENKITDEDKINKEPKKKEETELSEPAAINLEQAYKLHQQNVLFIDARGPADYQYAHIKNAINIPFDHFEEYKHLLNNIDKDKTIITYCAGTDCDLSILLGNILFEMGYKRVYIFFGGWNEWLEANHPIEKENQTEE
ncbi:MAG: rhodanese-like domain-containing protein [Ignavibacteria bacterium]|nr:rhodanese-like domain-containing protein [Ignavibacteria bacterium]